MNSLLLPSPAKLNLFLKVLNKRPDGFHNIVTVFERIDLKDEIRIKSNSIGRIRIHCSHLHVPKGPKNLVYQVAQKIQRDLRVKNGVDITITKRIPVAAGLAGGSSNAATVLLGLNRLWRLELSRQQRLSYARQIGSDVAFFLYDSPWALGTQKGDHIKILGISTQLWHVLVVPRLKMYSREVYGGLKLELTNPDDNVNIFLHHLGKNHVSEVGKLLTNDLQEVMIRFSPGLEKIKQRLKSLNVQGVMISGSGPAVFGITSTQKEAQHIKSILSRRFSQVFVVRTLF
mgnify:FL=1